MLLGMTKKSDLALGPIDRTLTFRTLDRFKESNVELGSMNKGLTTFESKLRPY